MKTENDGEEYESVGKDNKRENVKENENQIEVSGDLVDKCDNNLRKVEMRKLSQKVSLTSEWKKS